ncbi:MAG: hypothetical protein ACXVA7_22615 [Isosphaeraceae bacterium]
MTQVASTVCVSRRPSRSSRASVRRLLPRVTVVVDIGCLLSPEGQEAAEDHARVAPPGSMLLVWPRSCGCTLQPSRSVSGTY